jgi:hypothetical protein
MDNSTLVKLVARHMAAKLPALSRCCCNLGQAEGLQLHLLMQMQVLVESPMAVSESAAGIINSQYQPCFTPPQLWGLVHCTSACTVRQHESSTVGVAT